MSEIKGDLIKKYVHKIKTLESNIKSFHQRDLKHKGYLIKLNDYNNLKDKIQYKKNKNIGIPNSFDLRVNEKIMTIKDIEFKTSQHLINMLLNGNKYIIIDGTFWKVICQKGKENSIPIYYEISENRHLLKAKLTDHVTLIFDNRRKDNILEESILRKKSVNNFYSIKKTYQNIMSYYDLELKIKKGGKIIDIGYLIEKIG